MSTPILSVIIVAWKSFQEIQLCVPTIPTTINERIVEILVVDNSCDEDGLRAWVANGPTRTRYIESEANLGFGRANNLGFRGCSGDVILFLNPDTVCNTAAIAHCVMRVLEDAEIGLISPRLVLADGRIDPACRRSIPTFWDGFCRASGLASRFPKTRCFSGYNLSYLPEDGTYDVGAINGAFMMGRREVFDKVGLFDESFFMYGDDLDLCIRMRKAGYRVVYDGRVKITHLKGVSVAKDYARMSRAIFDANRDVFLKHFNPRNSRWVRWKYEIAFGLWKRVALARARLLGYRRVKPL